METAIFFECEELKVRNDFRSRFTQRARGTPIVSSSTEDGSLEIDRGVDGETNPLSGPRRTLSGSLGTTQGGRGLKGNFLCCLIHD